MCAQFSPEEETLFEKIGAGVLKRLRKTRNPSDLLSVIGSAHKEFDRAFAAAPAEARAMVACRAGCDACCHVPVGVQAHEVLIAAHYVQTHFSPSDLEALIARAAAHRETFAGRSNFDRTALKTPCVLLREGNCSIYEARPEACRSHHGNNAEACRTNLESGREDIDVYIPGVRGRLWRKLDLTGKPMISGRHCTKRLPTACVSCVGFNVSRRFPRLAARHRRSMTAIPA